MEHLLDVMSLESALIRSKSVKLISLSGQELEKSHVPTLFSPLFIPEYI